MEERLRKMAETRYGQEEFLATTFELAVEGHWFDLRHMIQHDMAKAILADYSLELGRGYLNQEIFFANWEDVIDLGWEIFCDHTGFPMDKVKKNLASLQES